MTAGLTTRAADCGPDCADIAEEAARAAAASPCADVFTQISVSLQHREGLLAASARASRLLLEATDVMDAIPAVLRELGAAAGADRVNLIRSELGPDGAPWMVVAGEWTASGITAYLGNRIVLEALSGMAWRRRKAAGQPVRAPDDPLLEGRRSPLS